MSAVTTRPRFQRVWRKRSTSGAWRYAPDPRFAIYRYEDSNRWTIFSASAEDWLWEMQLSREFAVFPSRSAATEALALALTANPLPEMGA